MAVMTVDGFKAVLRCTHQMQCICGAHEDMGAPRRYPLADPKQSAPSPILFPQIADGGDFAAEFILFSPGEPSSITLGIFGESGAAYEPEQ
jgi:hypothetical protein